MRHLMQELAAVVQLIKKVMPARVRQGIMSIFWKVRLVLFLLPRRPDRPGETSKARQRRMSEGFFARYCTGGGIDIGYGGDPLTPDCDVWDEEHGDAGHLKGIMDASYDFVYSSHTLEHMGDPAKVLQQWWRVVVPGGFLILYIPDRDLYEKRTTLPSRWNRDHKVCFLLDRDEQPDTLGILPLVHRTLTDCEIVYAKRCDEGHTIHDPMLHSDGEYSIEIVLRKQQ